MSLSGLYKLILSGTSQLLDRLHVCNGCISARQAHGFMCVSPGDKAIIDGAIGIIAPPSN